ncbi:hypothetical protein F4780DRAFT_180790 [Xylariomycetidae sp. FL0641]|nr:hypothetical protein F4780DRAFT_180790 [Xylariomycetidae sp. FL0641]
MKPSTILAGAFAAVAVAAPTSSEKRTVVDLNAFNQFGFNSLDLNYLNAINQFDLQSFAQLGSFNNLNLVGFQTLFQNNVFDVNSLLQLQQVALLSQLGGLGALSNFDLSTVQLNVLDLGLLGNIGSFDVTSIIDQTLVPQLQTVVQQTQIVPVVI